MKQTISRNLKRLRGKLRQKEVAAAIGIKHKTYQAYEEGRAEPSATILIKLQEYYHLASIDVLVKDVSL